MVRFFVSAGVVGEDRDTAVQSVAALPSGKHIEEPKKDIVGQKKARRLIERLKTAVGWDLPKKTKKSWMMQLLHSNTAALQYGLPA